MAYSLGVVVGENFQKDGYGDIPLDIFFAAMEASMKDKYMSMDLATCQAYVEKGANKAKMKQYETNKAAGQEFLEANKSKSGVTALPNGLQYEVIRMGDGVKPKATDEVIVHYHGTLIDGKVFDSSVDRGESISFPLNRVIKGWTEILQLMPVGSKWKVYIPYDMAYGDRAAGPTILPYSALIFEIDLLGIK
ncbi:MAG: FKBP-type peptidyl-prolyl cis-trans isomerase [Bacteroidota bacterium]|nr:FKBP-type peptidyl-prolyl cis-trans isomerase [Bacteroidota bacterium]